MITEKPEVARFCCARFFHLCVNIEIIVLGIGIIVKERSEFLFIKACQTEVKIFRLQCFDFNFQHLLVPARVKSHSVVCDYVRFLLRRSKIIYKHTRHFGDVLGLCSENSSVTCNNIEIPVDDNGIDKTKFPQRGTQLVQLLRRVRSGIVDVRYQPVYLDKLHFTGRVHLTFLLFKTLCRPFRASAILPFTACPLIVRYCCTVRFGRLPLSSLKNSMVSFDIALSFPRTKKSFHSIVQIITDRLGAVLLDYSVNFIPDEICVLLKLLRHLHEWRSNNTASGWVLA